MVTCKLGEKGCWDDGKCRMKPCYCENQVATNADRIRAMTDEELASFLCSVNDDYTSGEGGKFIEGTIIIDYDEDAILEWLQQPCEGD